MRISGRRFLVKRLVITADDFGLSPQLDVGIRTACVKGVVTHVSLVANGESLEDAVRFLTGHSEITAGVHLNLTDGRPLTDRSGLMPLLDAGGNFKGNHWRAGATILARSFFRPAIEVEYRTQIEKILALGIRPAQLNSHGHLHAIPALFDMVLRLASEYGIGNVRRVEERLTGRQFFRSPRRWFKSIFLSAAFAGKQNLLGCKTVPCVGVYDSGCLTAERLDEILNNLPEGDSELICHPGGGEGTAFPAQYQGWGYRWEEELALLLSEGVKESLKNSKIQLVNFR